jgi:hypothetical protein
VAGVASIIQQFRESHANKFTAIVVACGDDPEIATHVDNIVNKDLVETPVDMMSALEKDGWPEDHKSLLMAMSVNQVADPDSMKKRRNTFLDHLHAKEHLRTLEDALMGGVAKLGGRHEATGRPTVATAPVHSHGPGASHGSKFAQLVMEERRRRLEQDAERQMAKDVQRLAEDFMRGSFTRVKTPAHVGRHGASNIWCLGADSATL